MTTLHFNILSQHTEHRNLLMDSVYLGDRVTEDYCALLFEQNGNYVEVMFNLEIDEILDTRSFDSIDELQPYLSQISLPQSF